LKDLRVLARLSAAGLCLTLVGCSPADPAATLSEFEAIAHASCEKAMSVGVREHTADNSYQSVMVPKDAAIDGYSAAWHEPPDRYELIYETDFFMSCAASNTFILFEEAGIYPTIEVTKTADGYTTVDSQNPRFTMLSYQVEDGLISAVSFQDLEDPTEIVIEYAPDRGFCLELIRLAIASAGSQ
jgi:hypothetical protein